jgi:Predicted integral membrane protein
VALAAYFFWFAVHALDLSALRLALSSPRQLLGVLVAASLYTLIVPVTGWAWKQLLAKQGEQWPMRRLARVLGVAQIAKYIPGNIAQHASRAVLSVRSGMSVRALVATVAQETILTVAASVLVGVMALAMSAQGLQHVSDEYRVWLFVLGAGLGIAVLVLSSIELNPEHLRDHPKWWLRLVARLGGLPGPRVALVVLAAYAINYLVIGVGLWVLARAMGLPDTVDYSLVTAVFALSWVLGYLAPGAPAGLGAREGIMLLLLNGSAPGQAVVLFVLMARVVTMLGDALCFCIGGLAGDGTPRMHEDAS